MSTNKQTIQQTRKINFELLNSCVNFFPIDHKNVFLSVVEYFFFAKL